METISKETSLRDFLRIIFKYKYLIIITVIPVMVINYIALEFVTPIYAASVKLIVSGAKRTEATYYRELRSGSSAEHAGLVSSRQVVTPVVMALKLYERPVDYEKKYASRLKRLWINYVLKDSERSKERNNPYNSATELEKSILVNNAISDLSSRVWAQAPDNENSNMFSINVTDFDAVSAAIIANSISRSYVVFDLQQQMAELKLKYGEKYSTVVQIQNYIEELKKTFDGRPLSDVEILMPASVKIVEQAERGVEFGSPVNKKSSMGISFLGGLLLGVVLSLVIGFFDQRFRSPHDLESFLGIPMLGSIPKVGKANKLLVEESEQSTHYTNAFHDLADQVYLLMNEKQLKCILITDIASSKDIPVITTNLAVYIGRKTGKKVLIIDANLRNSDLAQILSVPNSFGLGEVLEERINLEEPIYDIGSNVSILPSGNPSLNPLNLLSSNKLAEIIKIVGEIYGMVFVISAGLNDYQDAVITSSMSDGVVLVVNEEKDRKPVVKFAINPIEQRKAHIVGAILNNRTYVIPEIIYRLT
jgi:capsular exopolysaccharide synthesis family protein